MSHFSVLVITDSRPSNEDLARILQPWHEFECTGINDQYVMDIDKTQELKESWEKETEIWWRSPDGVLHDLDDIKFFRPATEQESKQCFGTGWSNGVYHTTRDFGDGNGRVTAVREMPQDYEQVEIPTTRTLLEQARWEYGESLQAYPEGTEVDVQHEDNKYGYIIVDKDNPEQLVKLVTRTNPNKKWDWWTVGGRYSGKLTVRVPHGEYFTLDQSSCAPVNMVDFDEMLLTNKQARLDQIDSMHRLCRNEHPDMSYEMFLAAMEDYRATLVRLRKEWEEAGSSGSFAKFINAHPDGPEWRAHPVSTACSVYSNYQLEGNQTLEEWAAAAQPLTAFAFVKDGKWYEMGRMGWWAMVSDSKDEADWEKEVGDMVQSLRADQWITVVDCHI